MSYAISLLYGTDDCAPGRVTEIADAFCANAMASAQPKPSASATANAPLNVSPAATQSTAFTLRHGYILRQFYFYSVPAHDNLAVRFRNQG